MALSLAVVAGAGCATLNHKPAKQKPVTQAARNFVGEKHLPANLRRVVLLPVCGGDAAEPESAEALDAAFATALERQMRFEVGDTLARGVQEAVRRGIPVVGRGAAGQALSRRSAHDFAAQGVVFVDLTAYRRLRPIVLGVRANWRSLTAGS